MSGLKHNRERVESYQDGRQDGRRNATADQQQYASQSARNERNDQIV